MLAPFTSTPASETPHGKRTLCCRPPERSEAGIVDEEVSGSAQTRPLAGSGSWQPLALCTVSHLKTPTHSPTVSKE